MPFLPPNQQRQSTEGYKNEKNEQNNYYLLYKKVKITERRVSELIPVLGSQPAGAVSDRPRGRLPLLSARPAVAPATLKMSATNFAAW